MAVSQCSNRDLQSFGAEPANIYAGPHITRITFTVLYQGHLDLHFTNVFTNENMQSKDGPEGLLLRIVVVA